ncbi:hypothetical protein CO057_04655 [Candidatus Uhrbacteria bacterium CG_4_9_14_0_2_um_filter_41_50]|uniref:Uncharacterized protein n=1 Tax=Candidatus Uhrbacteria bacterium CG_4_9_14_0_2_um_filter_41_50 TaxID=1975031 RepID=A0A2M8EN40_9BACT|nr:MAG: hypothetical protein COZ45_01045 [Candidatus Uhrbacteria bacterium CG_4_10_14_3_um_filter_41_21]PJB84316.1 MAG: hypothetical protein CO086_04245 [Candidatus Uhrbacteria bacterium CG_4_9_14_0_8_um_filter_41_16]PJC24097.1 MAG: hypothetical protein CO057_04655 [Candidatus Uhrbacteria bacterium CG_4_9_14_0_2_um_filter_41_50]
MNPEKYNPTQKKINKAEGMMTEEQREASEIRAEYYEQEQPPWEDFTEKIDENFVRKKPSPEVIKTMNQSLRELGQAFEGSDLNWHLDGALNISLMNGAGENPEKYIGEHKDVDISVEKGELEALEAQLLKNGYGLFLSRTEDKTKNKIMRRASFRDFAESDAEHILIAAIDKNGKIRRDKALNFVDVHIIQKDETGKPLGVSGTPIPEKWVQPQPLEFQGRQINISHSGKVLYYKLHQGRNYDVTDAEKLIETGKITEEDIDDIEKVHEDEFKANVERGRKIFEGFANQIRPQMNAEEIFNLMQSQPEFQKREDMTEGLKKLAEKIAGSKDKSVDNILAVAISLFGVEEKNNQKRQELNRMRQKVKDVKEIERIRGELKK